MPDTLYIPEVRLPAGFQVRKSLQNGVLTFKFSSPVALPYDEQTREQYRMGSKRIATAAKADFELSEGPIQSLVHRVLEATLPEFIGDGSSTRFYDSAPFDTGLFPDDQTGRKMQLGHYEGEGGLSHRSRLKIAIPDQDVLSPVTKGDKAGVLTGGKLIGNVYLRVNIHPLVNTCVYEGEVSVPIIYSLLSGQPVSLDDNPLLKDGFHNCRQVIYAQLKNPSVKGIRAALAKEEEIAQFYGQYRKPIRNAAAIVDEANKSNANLQTALSAIREGFSSGVNARVIDETFRPFEEALAKKLRSADAILDPLKADFPREILEHIVAEDATGKKLNS